MKNYSKEIQKKCKKEEISLQKKYYIFLLLLLQYSNLHFTEISTLNNPQQITSHSVVCISLASTFNMQLCVNVLRQCSEAHRAQMTLARQSLRTTHSLCEQGLNRALCFPARSIRTLTHCRSSSAGTRNRAAVFSRKPTHIIKSTNSVTDSKYQLFNSAIIETLVQLFVPV